MLRRDDRGGAGDHVVVSWTGKNLGLGLRLESIARCVGGILACGKERNHLCTQTTMYDADVRGVVSNCVEGGLVHTVNTCRH